LSVEIFKFEKGAKWFQWSIMEYTVKKCSLMFMLQPNVLSANIAALYRRSVHANPVTALTCKHVSYVWVTVCKHV
jgi:hypothetical protein